MPFAPFVAMPFAPFVAFLLLVVRMLLEVRPGAPSSVLVWLSLDRWSVAGGGHRPRAHCARHRTARAAAAEAAVGGGGARL